MYGKVGGIFFFKNPKDELHDPTKFTLLQPGQLHISSLRCTAKMKFLHTFICIYTRSDLKYLHNSRKGQKLGLKRMKMRLMEQKYTRKKLSPSVGFEINMTKTKWKRREQLKPPNVVSIADKREKLRFPTVGGKQDGRCQEDQVGEERTHKRQEQGGGKYK